MDQINRLISILIAVCNYAKDIHYNCKGNNFYGNHLFADRITENINEYIDQLKEICLLGHGYKPLESKTYLTEAVLYIPNKKDDFKEMKDLLLEALEIIEQTGNYSKGDENLLGAIAQDLQNNVGLINIMFGE